MCQDNTEYHSCHLLLFEPFGSDCTLLGLQFGKPKLTPLPFGINTVWSMLAMDRNVRKAQKGAGPPHPQYGQIQR
jgi:hypothetical protein